MGLEDFMKEITRETESIIDTKTLIGDPVTSAGKTVMPIIKVSAGFGNAAGERNGQAGKTGFAVGGYAGVNMEPLGFIVISKEDVRLLTVTGRHTFSRIVDMVPEVVSRVKEGMTEVSEKKQESEETSAGGRPFGEKGEGREEGRREFSSRSIPEGGAGGGSQATAGTAGAETRSKEGSQREAHPEEGHREFSSRSIPEGGAGGGSQATAGRAGAESSRSRRRGSTRDETE